MVLVRESRAPRQDEVPSNPLWRFLLEQVRRSEKPACVIPGAIPQEPIARARGAGGYFGYWISIYEWSGLHRSSGSWASLAHREAAAVSSRAEKRVRMSSSRIRSCGA